MAINILSESEDLAKAAKLRYVLDTIEGFKRVKNGQTFVYLDTQNKKIADKKQLNRLEELMIPPAWDQVWICPSGFGHLQATGKDEKGRKQYIYHPAWLEVSSQNKFNKMVPFSGMLPFIRSKISKDMQRNDLSRERILATVVWLLDNTFIRIGNEEYARENQHYGLTTMRNKHVDVRGSTVTFEFVGKSGKTHKVGITHPKVSKTIKKLEELPGYELFQYLDEKGEKHPVDSQDVNDYLKAITKEEISAKDFRTWGGTVLSALTLSVIGDFEDKLQFKRNLSEAVKYVAKLLGNTTAVCRSYYIHPVVPKSYEQKILIPHFKNHHKKVMGLHKEESATRDLLKKFTTKPL